MNIVFLLCKTSKKKVSFVLLGYVGIVEGNQ